MTDLAPEAPASAPQRTRRERRRRAVQEWVLLGAVSSGLFGVATLGILAATYYARWIPLEVFYFIATKVWPFVCLGEIIVQIIPMDVRQQTQGWDVVADQWTSFLPLAGCLLVFAGMFFGPFGLDSEGWQVWAMSFLTALIEFLLLAVSNKLIAAARGSEETAV